jgi:hypothetical protein
MKTKLQKLQKRLVKLNIDIMHSYNSLNQMDTDGAYPFWSRDGARSRIDSLLFQRDAVQQQITNIQHSQAKCSIL